MHVESDRSSQTAVIIGASSGIGEALARQLNREGWRLCLMARRMDRLEALRQSLAPHTVVHGVDVTHADTPAIIERVLVELGGADLVQSVYLDGLRDLAGQSGLSIVVTEVQPGFVDTAMMKLQQ